MKLFVYEHITSGALIDEPLPASLAHEGNNMLVALINDLFQLSDIELIILRDARLIPLSDIINYHKCYTIHCYDDFHHYFNLALSEATAVLPIAPETDNILYQIQQLIIDNKKQLIGCEPLATLLCTDKYRCYQHLSANNIDSPTTCLASEWTVDVLSSATGYIVKPIDGAGCIDTLFFPSNEMLKRWLSEHSQILNTLIIQPFIKGLNLSLSLLYSHDDCLVLAINEQHVGQEDGQLVFCGNTVNNISEEQFSLNRASNIATNLHNVISGLFGYVGVDLIVTEDIVFIVDINPRLTSSYIGLANSIKQSPAELLFFMIKHNSLPRPVELQRHPVGVLL